MNSIDSFSVECKFEMNEHQREMLTRIIESAKPATVIISGCRSIAEQNLIVSAINDKCGMQAIVLGDHETVSLPRTDFAALTRQLSELEPVNHPHGWYRNFDKPHGKRNK